MHSLYKIYVDSENRSRDRENVGNSNYFFKSAIFRISNIFQNILQAMHTKLQFDAHIFPEYEHSKVSQRTRRILPKINFNQHAPIHSKTMHFRIHQIMSYEFDNENTRDTISHKTDIKHDADTRTKTHETVKAFQFQTEPP